MLSLVFEVVFFVITMGFCRGIRLVIVDWIGENISPCESYLNWANISLPFDVLGFSRSRVLGNCPE